MNDDPTDTRTIVNLLTDQVEFANVILLNKTDLVPPEALSELEGVISKLNPKARIVRTSFSKVPLGEVLNTGLFDYHTSSESESWQEELQNEHTPESEEYGIASFVFRDRRPFHPGRFWNYIQQGWPTSVVRSKGLFWLASRPDAAMSWSQAGGSLRADPAGVWWASMPYTERSVHPAFVENQQYIESRWSKEFGDRQNELVVIGIEMDDAQITAQLQACLCTAQEIEAMREGEPFDDPFEQVFAGR